MKIQTKDGINKKEANIILKMYRRLSIGRVTIYYSELMSEGVHWVSKKKGHYFYRVMKNPIFISKKNGFLKHGKTQYSLRDLIKSYKDEKAAYQRLSRGLL